MRIGRFLRVACACALATAFPTPAFPQIVETVGSRALGMGGAFVAVANDSSATWWNPAGLGDGPFLDVALARSFTELADTLPARRDRAAWFALGTPPFGFSYYRLITTDVQAFDPTGESAGDRQDRRAGVPVRSLAATYLGATVLQTLLPGIHAGTTLRYVRGTLRTGREDSLFEAGDLLDLGDEYEGGEVEHKFDFDVGALVVTGPLRLGIVGRNLREAEFGDGAFTLSRQVRIGGAWDASRQGSALTVAVDLDVIAYDTPAGDRRVAAIGAEHWWFARRLGVRAGGRLNTVGAEERAVTVGGSVSPRLGLYFDGFGVFGGATDERGWGVAARVSF